MGVFGDTLRQARAHKGVTLREAEQATRISRHYLLALEEEHFDQLPALIYQRGIVKNYATYLDLDQSKLLKLYQEATGHHEVPSPSVMGPGQHIQPAGGIVPNFAVIGFIVVMMAVVFAWGYSAYVATPSAPSLTQSPPTVTTVSDDDRFDPTATVAVPTATAKADPSTLESSSAGDTSGRQPEETSLRESEIVLPTLTATSEAVEITLGGDAGRRDEPSTSSETSLDDTSAEELESTQTSGERQYSFYTATDITLTIVVDNVIRWEDGLAAGSETPYLSGSSFLITFTGADTMIVVDGEGTQQEITGPTATLP